MALSGIIYAFAEVIGLSISTLIPNYDLEWRTIFNHRDRMPVALLMKKTLIFLLSGLLASGYAQAAEPAAHRPDVERLAYACAGCHGTNGHSVAPTPSIAGKSEDEFITVMREFKSGQRVSSIMNRIAHAYTDEDFSRLAQFYKNR
jgi:cytochrome subunit of sulfide dehydrogenase